MPQQKTKQWAPLTEKIIQIIKHDLQTSSPENIQFWLWQQIEPPLLETVMAHCQYRQAKAAKLLGISRLSLRTKLIHYFQDKYNRNS